MPGDAHNPYPLTNTVTDPAAPVTDTWLAYQWTGGHVVHWRTTGNKQVEQIRESKMADQAAGNL